MSDDEPIHYDELPVKRLTLERMKFSLRQILSGAFVESMVDLEVDRMADHIAADLTGIVLGHKFQHHEVKYPADWWQAVKERWFPRWAKKRWPVVYIVRVFDAAALYPDFRTEIPGQRVVIALFDLPPARWYEGKRHDDP